MYKKSRGNAILSLAIVGIAAGFVNGLLGAGGGIIIVFAVSKLFPDIVADKNGAFSLALCVMLPISILSCVLYATRGHMTLDGFGIFILPAVVGGALGGWLLGKIATNALKKVFSALVVVSGIILIIK